MRNIVSIFVRTLTLLFVSSGSIQAQGMQSSAQLANPASENCVRQGGKSSLETREDGAQFRTCVFADGKRCEEWAMFRGECPPGGIEIISYFTPAARFCAITGGRYAITANQGAKEEQGSCTFQNGKVCDAGEYYQGKCSPSQ
jgi:putative hemolysin